MLHCGAAIAFDARQLCRTRSARPFLQLRLHCSTRDWSGVDHGSRVFFHSLIRMVFVKRYQCTRKFISITSMAPDFSPYVFHIRSVPTGWFLPILTDRCGLGESARHGHNLLLLEVGEAQVTN